MTAMRPAGLAELEVLSAALGRDPEQVQAAGGNTSLKADGVLWVKASGLWLADAGSRDIFVPVDLGRVLTGIADDLADPVAAAVLQDLNPEGLRPSIETTLHALLPHAVVVHTHSVRTLALAICEDAEARLGERLGGLPWAYVPYCKPGLPLTQAVAAKVRGRTVDVLVLGNHGLVVGASSVASADRLLREVEGRLDTPPLGLPAGDPARLDAPGLRPATHAAAHGLAMDPAVVARVGRGSLYPDHVIFLGPATAILGDEAAAARGVKLFLAPGVGALLASDAGPSADELALCLALVMERVPSDARLRYLTLADEAELMNWDAEKYRQALAQARGR